MDGERALVFHARKARVRDKMSALEEYGDACELLARRGQGNGSSEEGREEEGSCQEEGCEESGQEVESNETALALV
jgi:hypothetical protein